METKKVILEIFNELSLAVQSLVFEDADRCIGQIMKTQKSGGKLLFFGNGGSASIASHASVDFTKAAKIRAVNFNEANLLTCFSNDYGYENWVKRAIEFYADKKDLVFLISSSGSSKNMINGADFCRTQGISCITFSGFSEKNDLRSLGDINFWVDSSDYNIVENTHQTWLLSMVDCVSRSR